MGSGWWWWRWWWGGGLSPLTRWTRQWREDTETPSTASSSPPLYRFMLGKFGLPLPPFCPHTCRMSTGGEGRVAIRAAVPRSVLPLRAAPLLSKVSGSFGFGKWNCEETQTKEGLKRVCKRARCPEVHAVGLKLIQDSPPPPPGTLPN